MSELEIGVLEGDGIGPEIVAAATRVTAAALAAEGAQAPTWRNLPIGLAAIESAGEPMPESTLAALGGLDAWILGPHDNASYPERFHGQVAPGGLIRKRFDLFANIRPAKALAGLAMVDLDLVVVRENTEGFYSDRNMFAGAGEFMPTPDMALSVGVFTRPAIERIAHEAFALARRRRGRVTVAHKANVLRLTTGLFLRVCEKVGEQYPDVEFGAEHVDALAALLVRRGEDFDVIVAENMFGDILSDLAGELAGSIGAAPSINSSQTQAMAQAVHGAAPDIAGRGIANPTAMILSSALLLRWLADRRADPALAAAARRVEDAVAAVLASGTRTPDLGGEADTAYFTEAVVAELMVNRRATPRR